MVPNQRITFEQIKESLAEITFFDLIDTHLSVSTFKPSVPYQFKLNIDIQMNEPLNGSYGKTYAAQWKSQKDSPIVLIKLDRSPTEHEISFYTNVLSHPHIVHTYGFVENTLDSLILLQERGPYGNLQSLLDRNSFTPSTEILTEIFLQILDALIYLTNQNLVHGDLRCANVLVFRIDQFNSKGNLIKLTNFSSVHENNPSKSKTRRTIIPVRYCAPEILRSAGQLHYSELSDVYSMGVLMWEACSYGQRPYHSSVLNSEVRQRKLNGEKLIKPWLCSNQLWEILVDCWHNEPLLRYNFMDMKTRLLQIDLKSENLYQYELDIDLQFGKQLHGKFYEGEWISKRDPAIILLRMDDQTARQEVPYYLKFQSHSFIIRTFGLVKNNLRTTILVQERAPHGNLEILLRNNRFKPSRSVLVKIFSQIIEAMVYIVSHNIIHGDLCCGNILVFQMNPLESKANLVKLTNFSFACSIDSRSMDKQPRISSTRYCAPELLENTDQLNYSEWSDVYSMGVLMWEACSYGEIPYGSDRTDQDIRQSRLIDERLPQPNDCNKEIWDIIQSCLCNEPTLRYEFRQLQSTFSKICRICSYCQNQYLSNDWFVHQKSCPAKNESNPAVVLKSREDPYGKRTNQIKQKDSLRNQTTISQKTSSKIRIEPIESLSPTSISTPTSSQQPTLLPSNIPPKIPTLSKSSKSIFGKIFSLSKIFGKKN